MSKYYIDMEMTHRNFRDVLISANSEPGNQVIVPNKKTKDSVEGFYWAGKLNQVVEIIVDQSLFLTGLDVYLAMWQDRPETSPNEYIGLTQSVRDMYNRTAQELTVIINKKGGWDK